MTILPHEKQIVEMQETIAKLKEQNKNHPVWSQKELLEMEQKLEQLKKTIYSQLKPWDRVGICRHPGRPHALDYLEKITDEYVEIFGDRTFQDDHAIITALARIDGQKFLFIGQEKGKDTESRLYRNFGCPHPEGYRKAMRCMRLAAKFHIPVISLLDTQGAYPGLTAEERGQGWAIANNLWEMARLKTPIIVVVIGEGCSGGALGVGVGDSIGMLQHAYYSVISPEGCASILWKDASKNATAAEVLKMHPEDLLPLGVIDQVIQEPLGGAHLDPASVYSSVKSFILREWNLLKTIPIERLLENRYQKFRKMGKFEVLHSESNEVPSFSSLSK
ncbi:MAG: acetyl-CoA carboxylase carboxyltransferase subunit alpha [Chlamydiia bacterium]|nr:acetyl-CoA carboxylase carboxyltransferase subunit alpha [Chlamydiia bacterium]